MCELDLKGFDAELAVISGRRSAVDVVHQLIARHGAQPQSMAAPFLRADSQAIRCSSRDLRRCLMSLKVIFAVLLVGLLAVGASQPAHAQFAVIDVASLAQLVQEVQQLEQQVATAQSQLSQAQSEYAAITGNRGMQNS